MIEILPHPKRGADSPERVLLLDCEIRAAEGATDERPIIEITSSSTFEDRHGSRIFEWRDEDYMRTGHVLWQHDIVPVLPFIGKKLSNRIDGEKSISTIELLVGLWEKRRGESQMNIPGFLWDAFRDYGMGAMSRGFIPLKVKRREAETIPTQLAENVDYLIVEQTEESFVNVPSNRQAFARGIERAKNAGRFNDALARMVNLNPAWIG